MPPTEGTTPLENVAQTAARESAKPCAIGFAPEQPAYLGLPAGWRAEKIDNEALLAHPRRAKATANLNDAASFIDFVLRYRTTGTTVWCGFDPQTLSLNFRAVVDEHEKDAPGWRAHQALYVPQTSVEWQTWNKANAVKLGQREFAAFLEDNEQDIAALEGMPTSGDMMRMALDFEAKADLRVKSKVTLQSGGQAIEFVNDADGTTTERMKLFDKFGIAVPVFWRAPAEANEVVPAYPIVARLRYRIGQPPIFWFELVRPDLVHQTAAVALIAEIRAAIGDVPMLMGSST